MKTWKQVEMRVGWMRLPYRVQDETLVSPDGRVLARTVQGASDRLMSPGHPDSKRQARRKQRDLARHGSRLLKADGVVSCSVPRTHRHREIKEMQVRLRMDQARFAREIAARLLGRSFTPAVPPSVPVDAFALLAHLQQAALWATGVHHAA